MASAMTKVLFVDDDPNILSGFRRNLAGKFEFDLANSGQDALEKLADSGPFGVVVADMRMPGMSGLELFKIVKERYPEVIRIMLTGNAEQQTAVDAINEGHVYQFINKPIAMDFLTISLTSALDKYRSIIHEREILEKTLAGAISILADVLAITDPATFDLSRKMRDSARKVAAQLKLAHGWELELAAVFSRLGLVIIPRDVAKKKASRVTLSKEEEELFYQIPSIGRNLLLRIPRLENVANVIYYHTKNFSGSGFPDSDPTAGEKLPLLSRLLKIILDFHTQIEDNQKMDLVINQMVNSKGIYDPDLLREILPILTGEKKPSVETQSSEQVELKDLKVGHYLLSDIVTDTGKVVIPSGRKIDESILMRLKAFEKVAVIKSPIAVSRESG